VDVRPVTSPDRWAIAQRLLKDLAPLDIRDWPVVDDVHDLSSKALRQLDLLVVRVLMRSAAVS
jgi:LuxR family transcriptional regulator, maltose regulon positive regulatory protein